jgi:hypothetical protein
MSQIIEIFKETVEKIGDEDDEDSDENKNRN